MSIRLSRSRCSTTATATPSSTAWSMRGSSSSVSAGRSPGDGRLGRPRRHMVGERLELASSRGPPRSRRPRARPAGRAASSGAAATKPAPRGRSPGPLTRVTPRRADPAPSARSSRRRGSRRGCPSREVGRALAEELAVRVPAPPGTREPARDRGRLGEPDERDDAAPTASCGRRCHGRSGRLATGSAAPARGRAEHATEPASRRACRATTAISARARADGRAAPEDAGQRRDGGDQRPADQAPTSRAPERARDEVQALGLTPTAAGTCDVTMSTAAPSVNPRSTGCERAKASGPQRSNPSAMRMTPTITASSAAAPAYSGLPGGSVRASTPKTRTADIAVGPALHRRAGREPVGGQGATTAATRPRVGGTPASSA
jgi:hypothetical protein